MAKLLEVIVTSAEEAVEAEAGGAHRLELVRALEEGGLSPSLEVTEEVLKAVTIPVRVMLRENASMSIRDAAELQRLRTLAREFGQLGIEGFVLGFVRRGMLDCEPAQAILREASHCRATFHRAFEHVAEPARAIAQLKAMGQIDRILTSGGEGTWQQRRARLIEWQTMAAPQIQILVGAGVCASVLDDLRNEPSLVELHVGRAARVPQTTSGAVRREQISSLKSALQ